MGLTLIQVILITIVAYIYLLDRYTTQFFGKIPMLYGILTGLILGDFETGLIVGAQIQLMSLGVANIGGASMPDYAVAAIISTTIAVTTGEGFAAGLTIGLPVGMLTMNLDVMFKLINSGIVNKTKHYAQRKEFKKMNKIIPVSTFIFPFEAVIPVFLAIVFGKPVVETVLNIMPDWFTVGLSVAGGMLPAVGIAMLLVYMPMKQFGAWVIVGFVLSAFLSLPVLGVALLGGAAATNYFKNSSKNNIVSMTNGLSGEDMEDE